MECEDSEEELPNTPTLTADTFSRLVITAVKPDCGVVVGAGLLSGPPALPPSLPSSPQLSTLTEGDYMSTCSSLDSYKSAYEL